MSKFYGNLTNRLEEDRMFCPEITVGTGMTEYYWSDRKAYEVVAVKDQKHVTVREYDVEHVGEAFENNWKLISNPDKPTQDLIKVGDYWYWTATIRAEDLPALEAADDCWMLRLAVGGWDVDKIREKGKQTKRWRAKVSFGVADYYYDYEF